MTTNPTRRGYKESGHDFRPPRGQGGAQGPWQAGPNEDDEAETDEPGLRDDDETGPEDCLSHGRAQGPWRPRQCGIAAPGTAVTAGADHLSHNQVSVLLG